MSLFIALAGAHVQASLRYERAAIEAGEIWRAITGHFVHLGWPHLGLNLAGLALVWLLVGRAFTTAHWWAVLCLTLTATSAALWLFAPGLHWYVGLSGALHGLLLAGAMALLGKQRDALPLLLLVLAKLAWEQWAGPLPGSAQAAGGRVIVDAHLYGALGGACAFVAVSAWRWLAAIKAHA